MCWVLQLLNLVASRGSQIQADPTSVALMQLSNGLNCSTGRTRGMHQIHIHGLQVRFAYDRAVQLEKSMIDHLVDSIQNVPKMLCCLAQATTVLQTFKSHCIGSGRAGLQARSRTLAKVARVRHEYSVATTQ